MITLLAGCTEQAADGPGASAPASLTGSTDVVPVAPDQFVRQAEFLDRGFVAVPANEGVLVSWRKLRNDAADLAFDVYRDGSKLTAQAITATSNFLDKQGSTGAVYELRAADQVVATTTAWDKPYLAIPITPPADGVTPDGQHYSYTANDASVGDLDGDGRYEILLKWDPSNAKDNSQGGYTGNVFIDAYTLDGKQLWRIDLGKNIRAGAHYTQFMVYDFDGNGRAEIALKTADGTTDGEGKIIGDAA
ncbi:MAG TPA: hypothetical protein VLE50_01240, partial [Cellvibrio sp.]|nr:hypothetical protein [Cellvibrio sp.]